MCHKTCDHKIYAEGGGVFISLIHQNHLPFDAYDPTPNTPWYIGHQNCEHRAGYLYWDSFQGQTLDYVHLWFNMSGMQWIMALVCSSKYSQNPSDSFHSPLSTHTLGIFPPVKCSSYVALSSSNIHNQPPHTQQSPPSRIFWFILMMCLPPPPCCPPSKLLGNCDIPLLYLPFLHKLISWIILQ